MNDLETQKAMILHSIKKMQLVQEQINHTMLEKLVSLKSRRLNALVELENAIKAKPEPNQQKLKQLRKTIPSVKQFRDNAKNELERWQKMPKLGDDDWFVYGLITYADGRFAEGLSVEVFDKDRLKSDDKLGVAEIDELGNFYLVYHTRDFSRFENGPDLYVVIMDKDGKQLHSTKDAVRRNAGRKELFRIIL